MKKKHGGSNMANKVKSVKNDVDVNKQKAEKQNLGNDSKKNNASNYLEFIFPIITVIVAAGSIATSVGVVWSGHESQILKLTPIPMSLIGMLAAMLVSFLFFHMKASYKKKDLEFYTVREFADSDLWDKFEMDANIAIEQNSVPELKNKAFESNERGEHFVNRSAVLSEIKRLNDDARLRLSRLRDENSIMKIITFLAIVFFSIAGLVPLIIAVITTYVTPNEGLSTAVSVPQIISSKWNFIALAFVSEFIAGLFVKVYFKLLEDSKHYINEYMVLSKNIISLSTLILLERDEGVQEVVLKMLEYKSNRILKKGETTEEIMREQGCDSNNMKDFLKIAEILAKAKNT
ncbi:MAG: hypothetical protein J5534_06935 [Fibrobacter sp.]|nr:hypothetical protein [Fibrobacter sp.]